MAKVRTQADRRQHATITDDSGRKWWTVIEKDTMRSCGPMIPKGWTAPKLFGTLPFVPPEKYHRYTPDDPFTMKIDYDAWIEDVETEQKNFESRRSSSAIMLFGSGAAAAVRDNSPELKNFVGDGPIPVAPIKAARAGNLFVLGLSPHMPEWAKPFFVAPTIKEEEFPNAEDYPNEEPAPVEQLGDTEFPDAEGRTLAEDPELERRLDLEEQFDSEATGGTRVDPRDAKRQEPPKEKPKNKPKNEPKAKAGV
jgi:hypothetical protein